MTNLNQKFIKIYKNINTYKYKKIFDNIRLQIVFNILFKIYILIDHYLRYTID